MPPSAISQNIRIVQHHITLKILFSIENKLRISQFYRALAGFGESEDSTLSELVLLSFTKKAFGWYS